ncbi:MAG: HAMP domain-containing sensor histidine kinase [Bacteroidales bacterium]|nr:HAMP domain-containing sensor histidine kinase [Bacteroidales bacterium]
MSFKKNYLFYAIALLIILLSLYVSDFFVKRLAAEERLRVEIWAEAVKTSVKPMESESDDLSLVLKITESNKTIPVIWCDENKQPIMHNNLDIKDDDVDTYLKKKVKELEADHHVIPFNFEDGTVQYIYYDDSIILKQLQAYPYIQLTVVSIFVLIAFISYEVNKRSEENKVWVGLSKETAHQLGTPISSLLGWIDLLKLKNVDSSLVNEISRDVTRLRVIAERFSKIGSVPETEVIDINTVLMNSLNYLRKRISPKVEITFNIPDEELYVQMNESLFGWVVENLTKNAVDAMNGIGKINFDITGYDNYVQIDVSDTGKGIHKSKFKTVFKPGYTTKQRGWGLGLSLVKRIVENYYKGKIFVKSSELQKGTTFRILLKRVLTPSI